MDLGTAPLFDLPATPAAVDGCREPSEISEADQLLATIRADRRAITDAQIAEVRHVAEWTTHHHVAVPDDASTLTDRGLDTGLPLAGEGAPLISDFAVLELGASLGRGIDSVRIYVGQIVELSHRLPLIWAYVLDGHVPVWKALRIADGTRALNPDAATYVDRHLSRYAATCSWAQVDRLLDEATTRFDPGLAEARRAAAAEARHLDIDLDAAGTEGVVPVHGVLDVDDALDLEQAVRDEARTLGELGNTASLDARRAMALGNIARRDLTLDLDAANSTATRAGRTVDLHVHLSEAAVNADRTDNVGRLANTRTPISVEQIRQWASTAATILVRPVIDIAGHEPVGAYEIAQRQARQVRLRDQTCSFPHCQRPAESCDLDHSIPHSVGGPTCACNLVPKCRGHHRLKTHGSWTETVLAPGVYHWRSRTGDQWIVTPGGTYQLDTEPCPGAH